MKNATTAYHSMLLVGLGTLRDFQPRQNVDKICQAHLSTIIHAAFSKQCLQQKHIFRAGKALVPCIHHHQHWMRGLLLELNKCFRHSLHCILLSVQTKLHNLPDLSGGVMGWKWMEWDAAPPCQSRDILRLPEHIHHGGNPNLSPILGNTLHWALSGCTDITRPYQAFEHFEYMLRGSFAMWSLNSQGKK